MAGLQIGAGEWIAELVDRQTPQPILDKCPPPPAPWAWYRGDDLTGYAEGELVPEWPDRIGGAGSVTTEVGVDEWGPWGEAGAYISDLFGGQPGIHDPDDRGPYYDVDLDKSFPDGITFGLVVDGPGDIAAMVRTTPFHTTDEGILYFSVLSHDDEVEDWSVYGRVKDGLQLNQNFWFDHYPYFWGGPGGEGPPPSWSGPTLVLCSMSHEQAAVWLNNKQVALRDDITLDPITRTFDKLIFWGYVRRGDIPQIAEVLIWDHALNAAERLQAWEYASCRYGLSSVEPEPLRLVATIPASEQATGFPLWSNNFSGFKPWHACKIGDDHIMVIRGDWPTGQTYDLIKISTGMIVDHIYDQNSELFHTETFGTDVYSNDAPDRTARFCEFEGFTVGVWGEWAINLSIFTVENDKLQINPVFIAEEVNDYWYGYQYAPATIVRTASDRVMMIGGGYNNRLGFIVIEAEVSSTSVNVVSSHAFDLFGQEEFPQFSQDEMGWPVCSIVDPTVTGKREVIFITQSNVKTEDWSYDRDIYRTKLDLNNLSTSGIDHKLLVEYPDLHPLRYPWRAIAIADGLILVEGLNSGDGMPNEPGARAWFYSYSADDIVDMHNITDGPLDDVTINYTLAAHTQFFSKSNQGIILSRGNDWDKVHVIEVTVDNNSINSEYIGELPIDPTGTIDHSFGGASDWAMAQVVGDIEYLVVGTRGWNWDHARDWEEHETWYFIYEIVGGNIPPSSRNLLQIGEPD